VLRDTEVVERGGDDDRVRRQDLVGQRCGEGDGCPLLRRALRLRRGTCCDGGNDAVGRNARDGGCRDEGRSRLMSWARSSGRKSRGDVVNDAAIRRFIVPSRS